MGDAASSCTSSGITPTLQGTAVTNTDSQGCVALPARPESPLRSSEFSTSSSSTSETFFTSAGRAFETSTLFERSSGGDTSSAISTSSSKKEPFSAHFDCNGISSDSLNIPSPILEEDLALTMHELEESDGLSKDLDLDMKPRLDDVCPSNGRCQPDSGCDGDMLLSRLDKLLNSDGAQEVVDESGFTSMNDLFPDFSCPPDFCVDEMSSFSAVDNFRGLDSSSTSNVGDMSAVSSSAFEEESVSQMFAQWLQSNAHWVSLSDLRKIKLKTSTIENATRRLGGGRKGLTLFLKFVLMWVQSLRQGGMAEKNMNGMSQTLHPGMPLSPNLMGTTAMSMQGSSKRGTFGSTESSDVVLDVQAPAQTPFSGCGSLPTALSTDWNTASAQGAQPMSVHPNLSTPASRGYTTVTNGDAYSSLPSSNGVGYSAFPSTNFYQSNSPWLPHGNNGLHGVCPTSLQPSLQPLAPGTKNCLGVVHCTDASSLNVSAQQRQCPDANPAATFRAARKNRMERQRWSVRRKRKWAASNQQQRLAAVASSNGYGHSNIGSWPSQSLVNGVQKFPYLNSQSRQPSAKAASSPDYQQSKKHERNLKLLFHKELKQSDVGSLGRIVLPKKAAETCLPPLELRDGVTLVVEDIHLAKVWNMRYRFWPNNKSRMYLLENTSDFVKLNDLKEGDYMMMYLDSQSSKYVIWGLKGTGIQPGALSVSNVEVHEGEKQNRSLSKEEASSLASFIPGGANCDDSCEDSLLVDFIEQTLEDF